MFGRLIRSRLGGEFEMNWVFRFGRGGRSASPIASARPRARSKSEFAFYHCIIIIGDKIKKEDTNSTQSPSGKEL